MTASPNKKYVYFDSRTACLYVEMPANGGASASGAYTIVWVFRKGKYLTRYYWLGLLLITGLPAMAVAQFSKGAIDSASNEIRGLTAQWSKAVILKDSAALEKILAHDFTLNGGISRSTWIDRALHHIKTDTLTQLDDLKIDFYGKAATSKGNLFWKAAYDGATVIRGDYSFDDIWIKTDGQWKVLMRLSVETTAR